MNKPSWALTKLLMHLRALTIPPSPMWRHLLKICQIKPWSTYQNPTCSKDSTSFNSHWLFLFNRSFKLTKYNALYHQTQKRSNSRDHTRFSKNLLKNSALIPTSLNTFLKNFTTSHSMQTCHPIRNFRLCHFLARKTSLLCSQLISNSNQTTKIPSFPLQQIY